MIKIDRKKIADAYAIADANTKKVLDELVKDTNYYRAPTLDDYTTIKTYEDACIALGEKLINFGNKLIIGDSFYGFENRYNNIMDLPPHILALIKLETISRALWGRNFQPNPDANNSKWYYYPWFALYTKKEMEEMSPEDRDALLSAGANSGASAGLGYAHAGCAPSNAVAYFGSRLCQETDEKACYFGIQFSPLWAEYLNFSFEVEE